MKLYTRIIFKNGKSLIQTSKVTKESYSDICKIVEKLESALSNPERSSCLQVGYAYIDLSEICGFIFANKKSELGKFK